MYIRTYVFVSFETTPVIRIQILIDPTFNRGVPGLGGVPGPGGGTWSRGGVPGWGGVPGLGGYLVRYSPPL